MRSGSRLSNHLVRLSGRVSFTQKRSLANVKLPSNVNYERLKAAFDSDDHTLNGKNNNNEGKLFSKTALFQGQKDGSARTGLFKNNYLTSPQGLVQFSKKSKLQAQTLVDEMTRDVLTHQGKLDYIKKLDQLSDILCRTIDVAEFIRVVHDDQKWVDAAQQTHEIIFEYMNQLNTNVELYANLVKILEDKDLISQLSDEEIKVGEYLRQDFERSGIHMDPQSRDQFVSLTQEISIMGSHFNNESSSLKSDWISITSNEFSAIEDRFIQSEVMRASALYPGKKESGTYYIPLASAIPYRIMVQCRSSNLRRKMWIGLHEASDEQVQVLNHFVAYRALLAKMLGYDSYAHYQLEHKMAKKPENVLSFLTNLQGNLKNSQVLKELRALSALQQGYSLLSDEELIRQIKPWDRDFLLKSFEAKKLSSTENGGKASTDTNTSTTTTDGSTTTDSSTSTATFSNSTDSVSIKRLCEYFSIGTVIAGLSKLFSALYNISFVVEPTVKGEVWNEKRVRKLNVVNNSNGETMGYLYLDFCSPKVFPSHFTVVCLRQLNKAESISEHGDMVQLSKDYQLPVVALVCNFSSGNPTLLSLDQVDTIFHEMGHAMHSMIGRTQLHNLSGTRCATDFVEIPSVLMESFSKDPRVLSEIGCHYRTGEPVSINLLAQAQSQRSALEACETFVQSKMAMLDQELHSKEIVELLRQGLEAINSTEIYHQVERDLEIFADEWSTWHGKFPHLFSYGAVYYSYLLDRAIANVLWQKLFAKDPWSRDAGIKYKEEILKWGGTKDPWACLADALQMEELRKGDAHAMQIIGEKSKL